MKYLLYLLAGALAVFLISFGAATFTKPHNSSPQWNWSHMPQNGHLSLVTEPADGIAPLLSMIVQASTSVDLVMYELDDERIEDALIDAKDRGVVVRVSLSHGYDGQLSTVNAKAYQFLISQGILVRWSPEYFALTHQKTLIVDDRAAMIMTFNLLPQFYATSRDFGIIDEDPADVAALESAFGDDWQGNQAPVSNGDDLLWSPGSEGETIALIDSATSSLDIYNEEMADDKITGALESAARRGVAVRVDMTYSSEWKSAFQELEASGVQVRTYSIKAPLYIHAKMILVDDRIAFVGSQNFSENSQNENRELGILISDPSTIDSLAITFNGDWKNAIAFVP